MRTREFVLVAMIFVVSVTVGSSAFADESPAPMNMPVAIEPISDCVTARMYVIAGSSFDNDYVRTNGVYKTDVNCDGTLSDWTETSPLPSNRGEHTSDRIGNYIITAGGVSERDYEKIFTVVISKIGQDGELGPWYKGTSLPEYRRNHTSMVWGNYLCLSGGQTSITIEGSTETICAYFDSETGILGSWINAGSDFAGRRYGHVSAVFGNKLYIAGGWDRGVLSDVQMAEISEVNGTISLGSWTSQASLPTGKYCAKGMSVENKLFFSGGTVDGYGINVLDDVQMSEIGLSWQTSNWSTLTTFAPAREGHAMIAVNRYLYILGGRNGSSSRTLNQSLYAQIQSDGNVSAWIETMPLPLVLAYHTLVIGPVQ